MPDRSSRHGLPDKWDHGSHARRQYSPTGASDGFGAAKTEAIPAKTDAYGPANTDPFASPPGGYGAATADPFGGANTVGAEPFGARNTDPFGAAATGAFGTASFGTAAFGTAAFGAETLGTGAAGAGALGAGAAEAGTTRPRAESAAAVGDPVPTQATDARSFLSALFDFGFTSFVTPRVIKALYVLIAIGTVVSALVFTIFAFKASMAFGLVTLIFADPLFVLIVLAIYRIVLEFFMVTFRVGEDIRALRERGELR
jgi:Domain of unknown function (DUF4282)